MAYLWANFVVITRNLVKTRHGVSRYKDCQNVAWNEKAVAGWLC
mgnify:CR=1 FL=1